MDKSVPVAVLGGYNFTSFAAGDYHSCGKLADGRILCWGRNAEGELGIESSIPYPVKVLRGAILGKSPTSYSLASSFDNELSAHVSRQGLVIGQFREWQYVAVTYDRDAYMRVYVNGVKVNESEPKLMIYPDSVNLSMGGLTKGSFDEARIYSRALSEEEIRMQYRVGFQKYNSTTYLFYANVTNLSSGTYTYYGWANDSAGNSAYTNAYDSSGPRYLIVNSVSAVGNVVVNDSDGGAIQLSVNDDVKVYCNASVTDQDGWQDVVYANATLYHETSSPAGSDDYNEHYTNTSCAMLASSGTVRNVSCAFTLHHESLNGTWNCSVTAKDSAGILASGLGNNSVDQLLALDILETGISFGNLSLGSNSTVANSTNITNQGNVRIDLRVAGNGDMNCTLGNLGIGNISYSVIAGSYSSMSGNKLSTSLSSALDFNLVPEGTGPFLEGQSATNLSYWTILIPQKVKGVCNNTVTVSAIVG